MEDLALDGPALEQRALGGADEVEPRREQRLHRGWCRPIAGPALVDVGEELFEEQRVATGSRGDS